MPQQPTGFVSLVGAGPGDPELITVRGLKALQRADVVVYDRLVNARLLAEIPARATMIYAGKAPGYQALTQRQIEAILIQEARCGRYVVRLKGGDPFVFGRGGEECQALAAAGIPFEVVPGVSSAIAAPAYAGIPVTQRNVALSFTVVTGHTADEGQAVFTDWPEASCNVDWARLPASGTLIILMGVRHLAHITRQLLRHGRWPETPAAIIQDAASEQQIVVTGTLENIAALAAAAGVRPPAVIVVGQVAALQPMLDWFNPSNARNDYATARAHPERPHIPAMVSGEPARP